jgi:hypothetical protein
MSDGDCNDITRRFMPYCYYHVPTLKEINYNVVLTRGADRLTFYGVWRKLRYSNQRRSSDICRLMYTLQQCVRNCFRNR